LFLNSFPAPALPGSGSEGLISALVLRHPYWFIAKVIQKMQKSRRNNQDLRPKTKKAGRFKNTIDMGRTCAVGYSPLWGVRGVRGQKIARNQDLRQKT